MIVLDTSALVRFFTRDDEAKAHKTKTLLESSEDLFLIDAVILELIFTLLKVYKLTKDQVIEVLKYLLSRPNIRTTEQIRKAVVIYEEKNLSITDCLIVVYGKGNKIASYDEKLMSVSGVKSAWGK